MGYELSPFSISTRKGTISHLGTPRVVTDDQMNIVWDVDYKPFGEIATYLVNDVNQPFRFPGQYADSLSGLYYNWNRYYMPEVGRYNSLNAADYHYRYNKLAAYFEGACDVSAVIQFNNSLPLFTDVFSNYHYVDNNPTFSLDINGLQSGESPDPENPPKIYYHSVGKGFCVGKHVCCGFYVSGTSLGRYGLMGGGGFTCNFNTKREGPIEGCEGGCHDNDGCKLKLS